MINEDQEMLTIQWMNEQSNINNQLMGLIERSIERITKLEKKVLKAK